MLDNMTLGQYYPADSVLHRMDPRFKIAVAVLFMVVAFLVNTAWGYGMVFVVLAVGVALSRVPVRVILRSLRALWFILLFTFVLNLFLTRSGEVLVHWWIFTITRGGLFLAVQMILRLVLLVAGMSLLTLTTSPLQLTDGIESLLKPLKVIHFPAHEIAMMMSIALRFIPTLIEETDKIMSAQKARGADFETGNLFRRAKAMVPILVPLFISAIRRADELATAMECRCYHGGEGRTKLHVLRYQRRDFLCILLTTVITAAVVIIGRLGY